MVIRTFHKQRNFKKTIGILIVLVIGVSATVKIINAISTRIERIQFSQNFTVGKPVTFKGDLEVKNNFPLYTHKITNKEGETMFLKSTKNNLNKYTGEVEIYGEIKDIKHDTPVVEVNAIKFPSQGLIVKENTYYFANDRLYLDFTNQSQLSARKTGKDIQIFYDDEKITDIEFFLCSKVFKHKDCSSLIENYRTNEKENFDSYRGYTYYKQGTGLWMMLYETSFGYIFKNIEEKNILDLSNIIRVVDKDFVFENKRSQIEEECKKEGIPLGKGEKPTSLEYENNIVHITIGDNEEEKKCVVSFDTRNQRQIL